MSIVDKMLKWWDSGVRSPFLGFRTYRVVFADDRTPVIVRADTMDNLGGSITFTLDGKVVAKYNSAAVVGVEVKS